MTKDFIVVFNEEGIPTFYLQGIPLTDDEVDRAHRLYGQAYHIEGDE